MPILAVCPYCHQGKIRAPEQAIGLSATCPRCLNCFTLIPSEEAAKEGKRPSAQVHTLPAAVVTGVRPAQPEQRTRVSEEKVSRAPTAADRAKVAPGAVAEPEPVALPPISASVPLPRTPARDPGLAPALVAFIFVGLGLAASQMPSFSYARLTTAILAGLGLLTGLVGLASSERRQAIPGAASVLSLAALVVVVLWPGVLNLGRWLPLPADDPHTIKSVGHNGGVATPAGDWVEVTTASWERDGVRVSSRTIYVGPVELTGPKNRQKRTAERSLHIWVRILNAGVARKVDFAGWGTASHVPRLTDSSGRVLRMKSFDPGWEPAGRPQASVLFPGKYSNQLLIYEAPDQAVEYLRLELPGTAFGSPAPVRLQIPRSALLPWSGR